MASHPIARRRVAMLEELGEEQVFAAYLRLGGVRQLVRDLWEPQGEGATNVSPRAFYRWLRAEPGRMDRWQEVKRQAGDQEFERVREIAGEVNAKNYREKKTEADIRQWVAERLNKDYSRHVKHDVSGEVEHRWLSALEDAEEAEVIAEGDYEMLEEGERAGGERKPTEG